MDLIASIRNGQGYGDAQQATTPVAAPGGQHMPPGRRPSTAAEVQRLQLPEDRVNISARAQEPAGKETRPGVKSSPDNTDVESPEIKQAVERLKRVEEKVKAHEAAHKAAGGDLAGNASYSYTQGPDGRNYITGGEVQINVSGGRTPEETITRMQQVIRAALAPADPSGQDRAVAAQAANQMVQAQQEKLQSENPETASTSRKAADPAAETINREAGPDQKSGGPSVSVEGNRLKKAYGDPAVLGDTLSPWASAVPTPGLSSAGQNPRPSRAPANSPFSFFA